MADVYRRGTKSVHRSILRGGSRFDVLECNLDPGGTWGPAIPAGPRCDECFGLQSGKRRPGRSKAAFAGTAAALALAAAVFASSLGEPVNLLPYATASGDVTSTPFVPVTPGPSQVPQPSLAPELTPAPSSDDQVSPQPFPTFGPAPTWPPLPTFVLPTWPSFPVLPTLVPVPSVRVCVHPGTHLGVDACQWPHQ